MKTNLKEKLVLNRLENVYCRLAPSKIHGVGVHAIKTIPKGTNPFKDSYMAQDAMLIQKSKLTSDCLKVMLDDYHPNTPAHARTEKTEKTENSVGPNNSEDRSDREDQIVSLFPNQPIWSNYINYTDSPNIILNENGEWCTLRVVEAGEELLQNPKNFFIGDKRKVFRVKESQYPFVKYN